MTLEHRRCHKCGRWMEFEMSYLAGNPIVIWRCSLCGIANSNESTIATNRTTYVDEGDKVYYDNVYYDNVYYGDKIYYVDTTNMLEHIWGGKRT